MLAGTLAAEECTDSNVHEFLKMLKCENDNQRSKPYVPIKIEEWRTVVMQSKVRSCSSVFSKRTHAACKCAFHRTKLTKLMVDLYNAMIREEYYVKRWIKILDVIIEKGKGPVIGTLRVIQLIEVDFQLILRIFFGMRSDKRVENDERFSKYNYGSRKGYSIETAILEKKLTHDNSLLNRNKNVYIMSVLEACHDRHLPNIGSIVEESLGA